MALIWNSRAGAGGIGHLNQAARASAGGGPWAASDGCLQEGQRRLEAMAVAHASRAVLIVGVHPRLIINSLIQMGLEFLLYHPSFNE